MTFSGKSAWLVIATDITGNTARGEFYHTITIEQKGGLVMPIASTECLAHRSRRPTPST